MRFDMIPGEQYLLRRKVFKLFGGAFHVYGPGGEVVAYAKQRAFKLREHFTVYADEAQTTALFEIKAKNIIDFSGGYHVALPSGEALGTFTRKGLKSTFIRDEWTVAAPDGRPLALITEIGSIMPILRRLHDLVALFSPQSYDLTTPDGRRVATFRQSANPFVFKLGIAVHLDDPELDDLMVLAAAVLLGAIEGQQEG